MAENKSARENAARYQEDKSDIAQDKICPPDGLVSSVTDPPMSAMNSILDRISCQPT
jgi:hypothetical protein